MKRFLALLLILSLFVGVAIAESVDLSSYTDDQLRELRERIDAELVSRQTAKNASGSVLLEGDFDGCHVILDKLTLSKDYNKKPAVLLHYIFKNSSSEAKSFTFTVSEKLFQSGIQLDMGFMVDGDDSGSQLKEIKGGAQIEVTSAFILNDTSSPIEIELSELFSFSGDKIVGTFACPQ